MKKTTIYIIFALQVIVLGLLVFNLFRLQDPVLLDASGFQGSGEYREGVWHIDESYGKREGILTSSEISLPAGVYNVRLLYETDTDMMNGCTISDPLTTHKGVLSNGDILYSGLDSTDFPVWVLDGNGSLIIQVNYSGKGTLTVKGAEIYDTGMMQRMLLFAAIVLFVIVDGVWLYYQRNKGKGWSAEKKVTFLALVGIIVYSSLPLFTDYILSGGDLGFHLLRIEGVKDGLLSGQFPVRIAPEWQQGYGYAEPIFYGDTLLYIPALFRLIGFPIQTSYKMFLFLLNVGTCLISYFSFRKIFKKELISVVCCMLYTISLYRLFRLYENAGLGEVIALMFLPLLVLGFYKIFTEDVKDTKYRWNWLYPTIAYCGIIQSHILSTYMVAIFTIFLCVIMWKKVFRKETFLVLAKVVIFSSLICAWFIVPFLDYMSEGIFIINNVSGREIQYRGLYLAHLLKIFFFDGNNTFFYEHGLIDAEPWGLGGALLGGLVVFMAFCWTGIASNLDKKMLKAGKVAMFIGICAMIMSLQIFPWDRIQRLSGLTATLVSSLEFPTRFLCIATMALIFVTGVVGVCIWNTEKPLWKAGFVAGILVMFLAANVFLINDIGHSSTFHRIYNVGGMGTGYVSSGEYLTVGTDTTQLMYGGPKAGADVLVEAYEKEYLSVDMECVNNSGKESYVDLPMLYYRGYRAVDDNNQELKVGLGENYVVRVILPGDFEGDISVEFVSPWYWRLAEIVSVIFTIVMSGMYFCRRKASGKK